MSTLNVDIIQSASASFVAINSTLKLDSILPLNGGVVNINGATPESANGTVFLGAGGDMPNTSNSTLIGQGAGANMTGPQNVAIGRLSLFNMTTGSTNTCVGANSGYHLTSGGGNALLGSQAGANLQTGTGNVCIGESAGQTLNGNSGLNTFIGFNAGVEVGATTCINVTCIGNTSNPSSTSAYNEVTIGNSSVTNLRAAVTAITSLSDARDKKEIEELPVGLDFVNKLKPVKFVWDDRNENGKHDIKDFGFIAQDLKAAQEETGLAETLKLVYESNPDKLEASYGKLVPILVKAMQEMSSEISSLKQEINELKNK